MYDIDTPDKCLIHQMFKKHRLTRSQIADILGVGVENINSIYYKGTRMGAKTMSRAIKFALLYDEQAFSLLMQYAFESIELPDIKFPEINPDSQGD